MEMSLTRRQFEVSLLFFQEGFMVEEQSGWWVSILKLASRPAPSVQQQHKNQSCENRRCNYCSSTINVWSPGWTLFQSAWRKCLKVLQGTIRSHGEIRISCREKIEHARLEINVLHLQHLSTLCGRTFQHVHVWREAWLQLATIVLPVPAAHKPVLLPVEHMGFDDLTARTAVQTQLQATVLLG